MPTGIYKRSKEQQKRLRTLRVINGECLHGKHTPEYTAFYGAKRRCIDAKFKQFKDYGGRGIEFRFISFAQFLNELGRRPHGLTLDRINTNGHYEPGNVRWATRSQQQLNRRK